MITYFKNLMTDEGMFIGMIRATMMAVSMALLSDDLDLSAVVSPRVQEMLAFAGIFLSSFMRSSTTAVPREPNG